MRFVRNGAVRVCERLNERFSTEWRRIGAFTRRLFTRCGEYPYLIRWQHSHKNIPAAYVVAARFVERRAGNMVSCFSVTVWTRRTTTSSSSRAVPGMSSCKTSCSGPPSHIQYPPYYVPNTPLSQSTPSRPLYVSSLSFPHPGSWGSTICLIRSMARSNSSHGLSS